MRAPAATGPTKDIRSSSAQAFLLRPHLCEPPEHDEIPPPRPGGVPKSNGKVIQRSRREFSHRLASCSDAFSRRLQRISESRSPPRSRSPRRGTRAIGAGDPQGPAGSPSSSNELNSANGRSEGARQVRHESRSRPRRRCRARIPRPRWGRWPRTSRCNSGRAYQGIAGQA